MDFQLLMTVVGVIGIIVTLIGTVVTLIGIIVKRRTLSDAVLIGWQLRSKPEKENGRRVESVRRWSNTITDPYRFKLVAMNVGRRDIEIDQQFPTLDESGTRMFSVELADPTRTVFTSVRADLQHLDGGGGENPNRWDMVPFHLSVGQALVVEGFTSGRACSARFHNLRHAKYVRRIGWLPLALVGAITPLLLLGVAYMISTLWGHAGFSGWTFVATGLVAVPMLVCICVRARMTERFRKTWSRNWSMPLPPVPQEIPRPPDGVSLALELREGSGLGTTGWSLEVMNDGLTRADDVDVRVVGPELRPPMLEECPPMSIDHGCALELAFTEWPAGTGLVEVEVVWRDGGKEHTLRKALTPVIHGGDVRGRTGS